MRFLFTPAIASIFVATSFGFDPSMQDDSTALARHFQPGADPVGPPIQQGSFEPREGETVTLMGGANVYRMQENGFLEAALQSAFPEKKLRVRNIGWPADTVYRQQRPMFFYTEKGDTREGSVPDQREKIEPGTFVLMFGRMESLDGLESLPGFEAAYQSLLGSLKRFSSRIVLIGPPPFVEKGPAAESMQERQESLSAYTNKIEELARKNGAVFVSPGEPSSAHFLSDGNSLSEDGYRELASRVAAELGFEATFDEGVRSAVREKNDLWHQYYRPTNWAFLFGDRQWVPSSRGHENAERRWFVEELAKLPGMIEKADERIREAAR